MVPKKELMVLTVLYNLEGLSAISSLKKLTEAVVSLVVGGRKSLLIAHVLCGSIKQSFTSIWFKHFVLKRW